MGDDSRSSASVGSKKMKSKTTKLRPASPFVLLFLCFASMAAQGQVSMKINLVAWGDEIPGLTLKSSSGKGITAPSFAYGEALSYSGPQLLAIYQGEVEVEKPIYTEADMDGSGKLDMPELPKRPVTVDPTAVDDPGLKALLTRKLEDPDLVALVKLPADSRHITILLAPSAQGTFQPYLIDDDPREVPSGALVVHNLSGFPVRVEQIAGRQQCELKPKGRFVLAADERDRFRYRISYKEKDSWTVATNNRVRLPDNQKTQLIVLQSDNNYFKSVDGTRGGFLQVVVLKRTES